MKQGKEDFDFIKDKNKEQDNYIFQKNTKTKVAFYFVAAVLVVLIFAVVSTFEII